jgi:hypothetical protein
MNGKQKSMYVGSMVLPHPLARDLPRVELNFGEHLLTSTSVKRTNFDFINSWSWVMPVRSVIIMT